MDFNRYQATTLPLPSLGMSLEYGRMGIPESFFQEMEGPIKKAFADMQKLEAGEIMNPDEKRRVGHYWLRAPQLAPSEDIRGQIDAALFRVISFAKKIHKDGKFDDLLVIGIGGSALGPLFASQALDLGEKNLLKPHLMDNTDPEGIESLIKELDLKKTLVVVISKSGSTPETRNGMLEVQAAYKREKLDFAKHAVAITQDGSQLDQLATRQGWLDRFPMWDFVGGRTSITSAVGLLPLALQGVDIGKFIEGAAAMDVATRVEEPFKNPAALLALCWYYATGGIGAKAMVVLPYKDRLSLFSRYLQQLLMESLGKTYDLDGQRVHQGLTVYGNKGSTDQHAYVQQLRDGLNNFFVTFIEVLKERSGEFVEVEPGITSGDYLQGFCLGTAMALEENYRQSMTFTLEEISPFSVGALVALFERAVGFYASMININAYHQPGVEAGKKAAAGVLSLKSAVVDHLKASPEPRTAEKIAYELELSAKSDVVYRTLERLSVNRGYHIKKSTDEKNPFNSKYYYEAPPSTSRS
jgi:glucose-6-phosphate isomerase